MQLGVEAGAELVAVGQDGCLPRAVGSVASGGGHLTGLNLLRVTTNFRSLIWVLGKDEHNS